MLQDSGQVALAAIVGAFVSLENGMMLLQEFEHNWFDVWDETQCPKLYFVGFFLSSTLSYINKALQTAKHNKAI